MIYCKGKRGLEVGSLVNSQAAILVQLTKQYFYLFIFNAGWHIFFNLNFVHTF